MTYTTEAHVKQVQAFKASERRDKLMVLPAVGVGAFVGSFLWFGNTSNRDEPTYGALTALAFIVSGIVLALAFLALQARADGRIARQGIISSLPWRMQKNINDIETTYAAVLALNPPADALQELVEHHAQFEETVNELLTIQKAIPDEDLMQTGAGAWLSTFLQSLERVQTDLRAVRLQSYTRERARPELPVSRQAIFEEQSMIKNVLARSDADGIAYVLDRD